MLLCFRSHHTIHLAGWELCPGPTGIVEVAEPNGGRGTSDPPGTVAVA
jgi:hypothetical protein